jgi:hypothetical protein
MGECPHARVGCRLRVAQGSRRPATHLAGFHLLLTLSARNQNNADVECPRLQAPPLYGQLSVEDEPV